MLYNLIMLFLVDGATKHDISKHGIVPVHHPRPFYWANFLVKIHMSLTEFFKPGLWLAAGHIFKQYKTPEI